MTPAQLVPLGHAILLVLPPAGPALGTPDDALRLIGESGDADTVVVPVARLHPDFLQLRTRMAGEFTQKFVNYRRRLVILGDLSRALATSDALRDFVRESNRGTALWFVPDWPELERRLGDPALAAIITGLIRELHDDRALAERTGALPVHADMGGLLLIAPDGAVLHHDPDTGRTESVHDSWRLLARTSAADRFPALASLRPRRPPFAVDCHACRGAGRLDLAPDLPCGACFGTGWLEDAGDRPSPASPPEP